MKFGLSEKWKEQAARVKAAAAEYFNVDSVGEHCFLFPELPRDRVIKIIWRVDESEISFGLKHFLLLFFGHIGFGLKSKVSYIETFHPVSARGWWRLWWLWNAIQLIQVLAILATMFGLIVLFLAGLTGLLSLGNGPTHADDLKSAISVFIGAVILLSAGYAGRRLLPPALLPGPLKVIGKWPLRLYKIQKVKGIPPVHS